MILLALELRNSAELNSIDVVPGSDQLTPAGSRLLTPVSEGRLQNPAGNFGKKAWMCVGTGTVASGLQTTLQVIG